MLGFAAVLLCYIQAGMAGNSAAGGLFLHLLEGSFLSTLAGSWSERPPSSCSSTRQSSWQLLVHVFGLRHFENTPCPAVLVPVLRAHSEVRLLPGPAHRGPHLGWQTPPSRGEIPRPRQGPGCGRASVLSVTSDNLGWLNRWMTPPGGAVKVVCAHRSEGPRICPRQNGSQQRQGVVASCSYDRYLKQKKRLPATSLTQR